MLNEKRDDILSNLDKLIEQRYSVRKYKKQFVEQEKLVQCVNAARLAPSARNNQPWKFIITTESGICQMIAEAVHVPGEPVNQFVFDVPAFITLVYVPSLKPVPPNRHPHSYYYDLDHGIALGYLILKATELGLGTCLIGNIYDEAKLKKSLELEAEETVKVVVAVGYLADEMVPRKNRKPLEEIMKLKP